MIVLYIILGIIVFIVIMLHFSIVAQAEVSNDKKEIKVKYLFFTIYPFKEKNKNKKPKKRKNKKRKLSAKKRRKLEKELEKEKQEYENALREADLRSDRENAYKEFLPESDVESFESAEKTQSESASNETNQNAKTQNLKSKKGKKKVKAKKKKRADSFEDKISEWKEKWEKIKPYIPLTKKTVKKLIKTIRIDDLELRLAVAKEDAYECAMAYGKASTAVYNALSLIRVFFTVSVKQINISSKFNSDETDYSLKLKIKTRPSTIIAISFCTLISFALTYLRNKKQEDKKK